MVTPILELFIAFALVLANGFFVASEFAIVKIRPTRLEELVAQGNLRARTALAISRKLDEYLSANQLGITLASLALGWIGEDAFARLLEPFFPEAHASRHGFALALSFAVITFLHTVIGELAPKSLAIQKTESTALWTALPLRLFYLAAFPVIWTLNVAATFVLRLFGLRRASEVDALHSPAELRMVLQHVALEPGARKLIDRVFDYTRRRAKHVMTLRPETVVLDVQKTFDEAIAIVLANQYSRYPLLDGESDQVLGYAHMKDLFVALATGQRPDLRELAREPIYCTEDTPVEELRRQMQRRGVLLAIVRDEDGGFSGMVTLEDLLEEFLGEVYDEHDAGEIAPLVRNADGSFEVDGRLTLDVLRREIGLALEAEAGGAETIGGYMMVQLGGVPHVGSSIVTKEYRLTVLQMQRRRVGRMRVERVEGPAAVGSKEG